MHQAGVWTPTQEQGAERRLLDSAPGGLGRIVCPYLPAYRTVQYPKAAQGKRLAHAKQGAERGRYLVGWDAHGLSHSNVSRICRTPGLADGAALHELSCHRPIR